MKQYDSYKDSGVEWIGKVPSHWEILPFKRAITINNGCDYKHVQVEEDGYPVIGSGGQFAWASQYMYDGEVVLLGRKGTIDKPLYYKGKFWTVDTMFYGIPKKNANCKYLLYQAKNIPFERYATATALPSMTQTDLNNNAICMPPLKEQAAIANYLDKKCSEIDNVISAQQKRIALLQELKQSVITHAVTKGLNPNVEMKDSGVEWIGEVPKHWEICKLKHVSSLYGRIGFRGYNQTDLVSEGEGAITLSPSNMQNGTMYYNKCSFLSWKKYYESPEIMIKDGDILFVKTGSTYGKTSLVNKLPMEATINPQIVVFKDIKVNNHFLYYLLTNDIVQMQVSLTVGGSTIPTLSQDNILNYVIPVAPKNEQDEIANYLDKKCKSIDSSISKAQHQVELLQEYKQSLITEVVTGKRKVC